MQITRHFQLREFTKSATADRLGIKNDKPPANVVKRLTALAELLEQIREIVGGPILVSSGWRSKRLNEAVGGSPTSDHPQGWAADIERPGIAPRALFEAIRKAHDQGLIRMDQLILYPGHVHVSAAPRYRGQAWVS